MAEYDAAVKDILSDKQVLAWILQGTASEYSNLQINEIIPLIEEPMVSGIPVNPGLSNTGNTLITGMQTESNIPGEGVIYYDIRFFVRNPLSDGRKGLRIIVDVEAQKDPYPGYDLVTRGIFYGGRMLSEQAGRNFVGKDYDSLEKVYSIWICFNSPAGTANTTTRYRIVEESVYGENDKDARSDLLQVVMVNLPSENNAEKAVNKPSKMHEMLYDLFVRKQPINEKIDDLMGKYGLNMRKSEGRIDRMCNLSEGVYMQGVEDGIEKGVKQGEERFGKLVAALTRAGRLEDITKAAENKEERDRLYKEFDL